MSQTGIFLDALRQQELSCPSTTLEHTVVDNKSLAAKRIHDNSVPQDFESEDDCSTGAKYGKKTRGRVKVKMQFIGNKLRRYTTFSKRKTGIMKKAYELSTLTGTQVMLLVASETGHVYTFATRKLQPMITSESGKALIQTCLNSPDNHSDHIIENDSRMNPNGFEETELTYMVAEEDLKGDEGTYMDHGESSPEDLTLHTQTTLESQINSHQPSIESQLSNLTHITENSNSNNQPELLKRPESLSNRNEIHQSTDLHHIVTSTVSSMNSNHSSTDALLGQQSLSSSSMSSRIALPQKSFDDGLFLQAEPISSQSPPILSSTEKSQKFSHSEEELQKQLEQQKALIQQLRSQHAAMQQSQRLINPAALLTQPQQLIELQQSANTNKHTSTVSASTFLPTHMNSVNTAQTQLRMNTGQTVLTPTTAVSQSGGALFYHSNPPVVLPGSNQPMVLPGSNSSAVVLPGSNPQTMIPEGYLPVINLSQTASVPVQTQQQFITIPLPLNNSQGLLQQVVTNQINQSKS